MKYQILTDGTGFIIKIKTFLRWKAIIAWGRYGSPWINIWKSEKEAETWIRKEYGRSGTRVRKYRIC